MRRLDPDLVVAISTGTYLLLAGVGAVTLLQWAVRGVARLAR